MPKPKQPQSENSNEIATVVAPIESVDTAPEPVKEPVIKITDPCWNCGQQLEDKKCPKCGFDKTLLDNLDLEAARAVEIQKAQQSTN